MPAEQAESSETKRFGKTTGLLLSAREAGSRTELPSRPSQFSLKDGRSPEYKHLDEHGIFQLANQGQIGMVSAKLEGLEVGTDVLLYIRHLEAKSPKCREGEMIKNILIPLDGSSHSRAALEYGLWVAEKFDGVLFGQHVIDMVSIEGTFFHDISGSLGFEPYLDFSTKMREVLEERGKMILEEFCQCCQEKKIRYQTFLDMGIIPNEICERSKVADLVVLGHRGINEDFSAGLLGNTAETVTRKCPRPVLVSNRKFKPIERPLLAYDGSQRASSAMNLRPSFALNSVYP